jgi:hypothetical protein
MESERRGFYHPGGPFRMGGPREQNSTASPSFQRYEDASPFREMHGYRPHGDFSGHGYVNYRLAGPSNGRWCEYWAGESRARREFPSEIAVHSQRSWQKRSNKDIFTGRNISLNF